MLRNLRPFGAALEADDLCLRMVLPTTRSGRRRTECGWQEPRRSPTQRSGGRCWDAVASRVRGSDPFGFFALVLMMLGSFYIKLLEPNRRALACAQPRKTKRKKGLLTCLALSKNTGQCQHCSPVRISLSSTLRRRVLHKRCCCRSPCFRPLRQLFPLERQFPAIRGARYDPCISINCRVLHARTL